MILPAVYDSEPVYHLNLDMPYTKIKAVLCEGSNKYSISENLVGYKVIDKRLAKPETVLDIDKEQIILCDGSYYESVYDETSDTWNWSLIDLGELDFQTYWLHRVYKEWEAQSQFIDKNYINKIYTFHYVEDNDKYLNS
jgi:hypothetical protein